MKNPFSVLIFIIGFVGWFIFGAGCTNTTPTVVVPMPTQDTLEAWHCTPIAPMKTDGAVAQKGKAWPNGSTIKIGFPFGGTEAQKTLAKNAFAAWKASPCNLNFEYPSAGPYDIRIAFSPGSAWSYIGTDAKLVSANYPTLNFGFGYGAAEQAAGRSATMEHEAGHALSALHEQQLAGGVCWNEANVIADLSQPPNSWSIETIRFNVLDYHNPANIITNGYDKTSIMHYAISARWTCNNVAINGGNKISEADKAFMASVYRVLTPPPPPNTVTITTAKRDSLIKWALDAKNKASENYSKTRSVFGL